MKLIICIRMDLALDNLQRLICHKTPTNLIMHMYAYKMDLKPQFHWESYHSPPSVTD